MKHSWKRVVKWILLITFVISLICLVAFGVFIYKISNEPFMDDGPFVGIKTNECDLSNPHSSLNLPNSAVIESFLPKNEGEAPIVRYRNDKGLISWCIYANGYENTSVASIEFYSVQSHGYDDYLVKGMVHWTYGRERTLWYLSTDGSLINYWYSW